MTTDHPSIPSSQKVEPRVWDLSLRIWHWLFAMTITFSLGTGLSDNLALIDWHLRSGYTVVALLTFRLCWGLFGTRFARFSAYRTSPALLLEHLKGTSSAQVHTAPGVVMAWSVWLTCVVQAGCGLFSSDDIFTEGPLARYASDIQIDTASYIHARAYWLLIGLIGIHLTAILWYGLVRRDPLALSMFTGRKSVAAEAVAAQPTAQIAATVCAWLAAALVFGLLASL
jgi:cytochrome b